MSLIDIGNQIDKGHPKPFVQLYLRCMAQGFILTCPTDKDEVKLLEKWEVILSKHSKNFSDDFCKGVVTYWLELLLQCDIKSSEFEAQLFKAANISSDDLHTNDTPSSTPSLSRKNTSVELPKVVKPQKDPLTTPEISEQYHQRQLAENVSLPTLEKLTSVYKKSFKQKNVTEFLISHLTFAKYQKGKPVPKSTLPQSIRQHWEDIIASEFNTIASDEFLLELTNEWFYLVNQKGIPIHDQHLEEILMTFLAKQQGKKEEQKNPPSIFKKLFG